MAHPLPAVLGGLGGGLANGLFGGGGGMLLLPVLARWGHLPERALYPTCLAVMLPASMLSAAVYLLRDGVSLTQALPCLLGGALGGALGARFYRRVPLPFLRRLFALFLLYAGIRYLF